VLDQLLLAAAERAGATVRTGVTVTGVRHGADGRIHGVDARTAAGERPLHLAADVVVGADGVRSRLAGWVDAPTVRSFRANTATFYAYAGDVPWEGFEFHLARNGFAGVFPTHGGEACVWLAAPTPRLGALRAAGANRRHAFVSAVGAASPELGERLRAARVNSPVRGAVNLPNHVRRPAGPGWALVGDAGYHRDPITGHGITDAFRDAELLAGAIDAALSDPSAEREAMSAYEARRDRSLQETWALTRELAAFPDPERFVELQIQLSDALEREAADLAALPLPVGAATVAA